MPQLAVAPLAKPIVPRKRKVVKKVVEPVVAVEPVVVVAKDMPKVFTKLIHGAAGAKGRNSYYGGGSCIGDPALVVPELKFKPRTEFLRSLAGEYQFSTLDVPVKLRDLPEDFHYDEKATAAFNAYAKLAAVDARLPKFSKWLNSVYPDYKTLHDAVARAMQKNQSDTIVFGVEAIDIYNGGNSDKFATCLGTCSLRKSDNVVISSGTYKDTIHKVMTDGDGIAVIYMLDKTSGVMKGRCWAHHVVHPKHGDVLHLANIYGAISHQQIIAALKPKFPDLIIVTGYGYGDDSKNWKFKGYPADADGTFLTEGKKFPGCGNYGWHWDTRCTLGQGATLLAFPPNPKMVGQGLSDAI